MDPEPPEPDAAVAPVRVPLPGGVFTGALQLIPGYNCVLSVSELSQTVTITASLGRGDGEQCEDLRTDDDGNLVPETCLSCGDLVYAINAIGFDVEHLQLVGGPGVVIDPDPDNNRVYVRLEEEGICEVQV